MFSGFICFILCTSTKKVMLLMNHAVVNDACCASIRPFLAGHLLSFSLSLSLSLSISLSLTLYLSLFLSLAPPVELSLALSVTLSLSIYLYLCISISYYNSISVKCWILYSGGIDAFVIMSSVYAII